MAKTSKKAKKVNFDSLEQIDGALAPSRSVQDMLGDEYSYSVPTVDAYLTQIRAMSDADLHDHSVKVRVTPISDRNRLEDRLEREFLTRSSRKVFQPTMLQMSPEAQARQQRLMRGGF